MTITSQVKLYYDDVLVGMEIPTQVQELTIPVMIRWCGAAEIFSRDHIDHDYAIQQGLEDIIGSGWWTQARLYKLLSDWVGESGWVWKLYHQLRGNLLAGYVLTFGAKVVDNHKEGDLGYVDLELSVTTQHGITLVPGHATVVLPVKGGGPIPYPFEAPTS